MLLQSDSGGKFQVNGNAAVATTGFSASYNLAPISGNAYTVTPTDYSLVISNATVVTITLPSASTNIGRILNIKCISSGGVNSASSNVLNLATNGSTATILQSGIGKWAMLQSNGANWVIMMEN
jgi:hypothetical protein